MNLKKKKIEYQSEIDGLRALAIFLVFGFHFFENDTLSIHGYNPFSGGFIGVDIFFVISGYLIALIIKSENDSKSFNFFSFLIRRIRRIVPALILVSFLTLIMGVIFLLPFNLIDISYSFLSLSLFLSNIYFFISGKNYSALEQFPQPFIHTWSLSIEWQYYVIFSLFFLFLIKFLKKSFFYLYLIILLFFIFSAYLSYKNEALSFFLIFSRIWEFFIGVLLVFVPKKKFYKNKYLFYSIFGLVLILTFNFCFDERFYHPGFFTIVPIFGTYLLIRYSHNLNPVTNLFRLYPIRYIGLSSYSLYLYHYPLIAFTRIVFDKNDSNFLIIGFLLVSLIFILSFLSYEFVEKPFRNKNKIDNKTFLITNLSLTLICLAISIFILKKNGFESKWKISSTYSLDNRFYENEWYKVFENNKKIEFKKNFSTKILIVGDSHGNDFFNLLNFNKNLYEGYEFAFLNSLKIDNSKKIRTCDYVIFSKAWKYSDLDELPNKIDFLQKLGKKVFLASHNVTFPLSKFDFTISDDFLKKISRLPNKIEKKEIEHKFFEQMNAHREINKKLKKIAESKRLLFFNKYDYLCSTTDEKCEFLTDTNSKIYFDEDHYTLEGSKYIGKKFFEVDGKFLLN